MQVQQNKNQKPKVNLENIKNYVEGNGKRFVKHRLPPHILEQINLRSFICSDCLKNTKCLHCGCTTPHLFYARSKKDPNWGPYELNKDKWENTKESTPFYQHFVSFNTNNGLDNTDPSYPPKLRSKLLKSEDTLRTGNEGILQKRKSETRDPNGLTDNSI